MEIRNFNPQGEGQWTYLDEVEFDDLERQRLFLPYSDVHRHIPKDDVWLKMHKFFPLSRLHEIKQLSLLSYSESLDALKITDMPFSHTRYLHSQQVSHIGGEIQKRNGATMDEVDRTKIIFGLHDLATVAHGDTTKILDRKALNEETNWQNISTKKGIKFLSKHNISPDELSQYLQNNGLEGKLLDVVDRICYTLQDAYSLLGPKPDLKDRSTIDLSLIILKNPNLGNIYKDIGIDRKNEKIVFRDENNLADLLLMRALLHKNLYMNPFSMGRDMLAAQLMKPFYNTTGSKPLSPESLLAHDDISLEDFLNEQYNTRLITPWYFANFDPDVTKCYSLDEAYQKENQFIESGKTVIGIRESTGFNTSTDLNIIQNNQIVPFSEASTRAREIQEVEKETRGIFIFTMPENATEFNKLLINARSRM